MKRSALLLGLSIALAACGSGTAGSTTTSSAINPTSTDGLVTTTSTSVAATLGEADFPVTVEADNGEVVVAERPDAIISLSSSATEILFAIGAGEQVVAVDDQSNFPAQAPSTDLSGFTPNIEAILAHQPDLVIISYEPGDLEGSLEAAGVAVLFQDAATTVEEVYEQVVALGAATGHTGGAAHLNEQIESGLATAVSDAPAVPEGTTYYHELDNTFFSATSSTFFGELYGLFDLVNIADAADPDGAAGGFPQLSSEYVVAADPDLIFLADTLYGESQETVAARPGWDAISAVSEGHVFPLDSDIASRWGPRIVDFVESISAALDRYLSEG